MMIIFVWNNFWIVFIDDRIVDEVDFIVLIFDWFWIVS